MSTPEEIEQQFEETAVALRSVLTGDENAVITLPGGGTVRSMRKIDKDAQDALDEITDAFGNDKVDKTSIGASGGIMGFSGFKAILKNAAGLFPSFLVSLATAQRTWNMPDKDGDVALTSDITGKMGIPDGMATLGSDGLVTPAQVTNLVKTNTVGASDGVASLSGFKHIMKNAAGTVASFLTSGAATARTWTMPDQDGTVALISDILSKMGVANGLAPLDSNALISPIYLPSYVDDVLEYDTKALLLAANNGAGVGTGVKGKIYVVDADESDSGVTNQYRWSGSVYTKMVGSPGTTDAVPEGAGNKYFTTARVLATALAGLSTATASVPTAADTLLIAMGKLAALWGTKDASGGFVGLTGFSINFKNAAGTFTSTLANAATAARTYTFPNRDITVAGVDDVLPTVATGMVFTNFAKALATDTLVVILGKLQAQINAIPFDVMTFVGGKPAANGKTLYIKVGRAFTIPANFTGAKVKAVTAATGTSVWTLTRNGTSIGTFSWAAAGTIPTLATAGGAAINIAVDDELLLTAAATQDATLADIGVHILATLT